MIIRWLVMIAGVVLIAGCRDGTQLKLVPVSGTVTLDRQPLPDGVIVFTKDGEIPRELKITNGAFSGEAYAGKNHIQFAAYRPLGQPKKNVGPGADEGVAMENVLPSRYNQESKEFRDLTDGPNEFHFELSSK